MQLLSLCGSVDCGVCALQSPNYFFFSARCSSQVLHMIMCTVTLEYTCAWEGELHYEVHSHALLRRLCDGENRPETNFSAESLVDLNYDLKLQGLLSRLQLC